MDYSLAKELKDAGFPQVYSNQHGNRISDPNGLIQNADTVYVPTLEELIEACGTELESLSRIEDGKRWFAYTRVDDGHGNNIETAADTAIDAVARLWIALNEK